MKLLGGWDQSLAAAAADGYSYNVSALQSLVIVVPTPEKCSNP